MELDRVAVFKRATSLMIHMGFRANQYGYKFLREAIWQVWEEPEKLELMTKWLYPSEGKEFQVTGKQVERAIRNSIETAWTIGNKERQAMVFENMDVWNDRRPTNMQAILAIIEYLKKENTELADIY